MAAPPTTTADDDAADPLPGHSLHGEAFNEGPRQAARLLEGTGRVSFVITTKDPQAQVFFNQGVGQLHGFWYFEAERSFHQAAALDPDSAMAYWGMAMANINNTERAKKLIAEAVKRKSQASAREQLWIDALAEYYADPKKKEADRRTQYVRRLENIIHEHPDDVEAKAFLGVLVWQNHGKGVNISSYQATDALLQQVLAVEPLHPVHHYRIHLWDKEKVARALDSAARCGPAAPAIAHMWHMPGHVYSGLQRYGDAVWQQEASSRVDHRHMIEDRLMPDEIHNYAHNQEWMIRNLSYLGRAHDAVAMSQELIEHPRHPRYNTLAKSGSYKYGRSRLLQMLQRFELWDELIALSDTVYLEPTDDEREQVKRLRALGAAYFGAGRFKLGREQIATLDKLLKDERAQQQQDGEKAEAKVRDDAKNPPPEGKAAKPLSDKLLRDKITKAGETARNAHKGTIQSLENALAELRGHDALGTARFDSAIEQFAKADALGKEFLSRVQLQANHREQAEKLAREAVKSGKGQVYPLANLVYILHQVDKQDEARRNFDQLRSLAAQADLDLPFLARLAPLVKEWDLPADWRLAATTPDDLGERPELDSLGPLRWRPSLAPEWRLPDGKGGEVSLADYRGKPVVILFYLGFGCTHCVEQLKVFASAQPKFNDAGIALVAISNEPVASLQQSLAGASAEGPFPFTLASDVEQTTFKRYRVYDDFEQQPLHATLLVDGQGFVRWQDVSYEPFTDTSFLLAEAQRLLRVQPSGLPEGAPVGPRPLSTPP